MERVVAFKSCYAEVWCDVAKDVKAKTDMTFQKPNKSPSALGVCLCH